MKIPRLSEEAKQQLLLEDPCPFVLAGKSRGFYKRDPLAEVVEGTVVSTAQVEISLRKTEEVANRQRQNKKRAA